MPRGWLPSHWSQSLRWALLVSVYSWSLHCPLHYILPGAQLPALAFTLNTGLAFAALLSEAGRATSGRPISAFICIMVAAIDPDKLCCKHSRVSSISDLNERLTSSTRISRKG